MAKQYEHEFKTLLTKAEYEKVMTTYKAFYRNTQVNYYFDTTRFTLKASEIGLRVRLKEDETYVLTCKRKRGYVSHEINHEITQEEFKNFLETGVVTNEEVQKELADVIKGQKLVNYLTLATKRISFPHKSGKLCVDKCKYVDTTDYELIFETNTYEKGKKEFVETVKSLGVTYKKAEPKMKRANAALRRKLD